MDELEFLMDIKEAEKLRMISKVEDVKEIKQKSWWRLT